MFSFIAFVLTIFGGINWLTIGFLQYDIIAGFFGFQASIFSRVCYIIFGLSSVYVLFKAVINKGNFKIFERKNKKQNLQQNVLANANVEPSKEYPEIEMPPFENANNTENRSNLFDEHLKK